MRDDDFPRGHKMSHRMRFWSHYIVFRDIPREASELKICHKQAEAEVVPSSSSVRFIVKLDLSRCNLDANLMKLDRT